MGNVYRFADDKEGETKKGPIIWGAAEVILAYKNYCAVKNGKRGSSFRETLGKLVWTDAEWIEQNPENNLTLLNNNNY